ncbi:MAG: hypothetical protein PHI12_12005 [Dehalococcoidales bacterium]|nr:hypothetical protein [Dehalococcoidales bacterium]
MPEQSAQIDYRMNDSQFMSADDKMKVLRQWETFLASCCQHDKFGKALYHHLIDHCDFIAHYDIHGFYAEYFTEGYKTIQFLRQFDRTSSCLAAEGIGNLWLTSRNEYHDVNNAMVLIAGKYMPYLMQHFSHEQKDKDLAIARRLLIRHGLKPTF